MIVLGKNADASNSGVLFFFFLKKGFAFLENLQLTKKSGHVLVKGQQCFLKHRLVVSLSSSWYL